MFVISFTRHIGLLLLHNNYSQTQWLKTIIICQLSCICASAGVQLVCYAVCFRLRQLGKFKSRCPSSFSRASRLAQAYAWGEGRVITAQGSSSAQSSNTNIPLAKANHVANPKVKVWESRFCFQSSLAKGVDSGRDEMRLIAKPQQCVLLATIIPIPPHASSTFHGQEIGREIC